MYTVSPQANGVSFEILSLHNKTFGSGSLYISYIANFHNYINHFEINMFTKHFVLIHVFIKSKAFGFAHIIYHATLLNTALLEIAGLHKLSMM